MRPRTILPFTIALITIINLGVAWGFTSSQAASADFSVSAATTSLAPGDIVEMTILMDASAVPVSAAQAYLDFDESVLQVVDAGGTPVTAITQGPIFNGSNWTVLQNDVDNNAGTIDFAGGKTPVGGTDLTTQATLATFYFEAQAAASGTSASFATTVPRRTRAVSGFNDVTGSLSGSTLTVTSNNDVVFNFSIQGRGATGPSWTMPMDVRAFVPGSDMLVASATPTSAASASNSSSVTLLAVSDGTYDIWSKGDNTLAKLTSNVTVSASTPVINLGELIGGDATGGSGGAADNVVDAADYSGFLSIPIGTAVGTLSSTQQRQDHNRDGLVDIVDYAVIVENFGRAGAPVP